VGGACLRFPLPFFLCPSPTKVNKVKRWSGTNSQKLNDLPIIGVCTLWPTSQIQPAAHFCTAYGLRMVFTFLNGRKKSRERLFGTCKNFMQFTFQRPYWKTATLISLLSEAAFGLQWQDWVLGTETAWLTRTKVITIWPCAEKFSWPLTYYTKGLCIRTTRPNK